jgi:5-formyltetrahydrofolate cyclo-ligase
MTKQEARDMYAQKRLQLTESERNKFDDLLLIQFQKLVLPALHYVHTYLAIDSKKEFVTDNILNFLEFRHPAIQFILPRVNEVTKQIESVLNTDELKLQKNKWGIAEPVDGELINPNEIDMVIVPLMAFDENGHRVGYGKGYYDKFLAQCRTDVIKVGFSYFEAIAKITDSASFDIPLSYCVTPHRIYEFG